MGIFKEIQGIFRWATGARRYEPVQINWELPPQEILRFEGGDLNLKPPVKPVALELCLAKFGFNSNVTGVQVGPTSTIYQLSPVGLTSIKSLSKIIADVGVRLGVHGIRDLGHLPGSSSIGIEVDSGAAPTIRMGHLNSVLANKAIPVPLGISPDGKAVALDLAEAPHMIVAGSTGSGKSVFINSLVSSILALRDPDQVQLVMIDPKMVEFQRYAGIPHLLMGILTETGQAVEALSVLERFMDDRFRDLARAGFQDINSYNSHLDSMNSMEPRMNRIVIIIDEFADLIMQSKHVEAPIIRIAQKARAAGMHLVIGTQRPIVKVVTGLIKANIPARVCFRVPSSVDSRVVLDQKGAEKLGGPGDLLACIGRPGLVRAQAPLIEPDQIQSLVNHWRPQEAYLSRYR